MKFAFWLGVVAAMVMSSSSSAAPATSAPAATVAPEVAFVEHLIVFKPACFSGAEFPACDFDDPAAVQGVIGPYKISVKYFDAAGAPVTRAAAQGRYGA